MTTRRGLFGLFAGVALAPLLPASMPVAPFVVNSQTTWYGSAYRIENLTQNDIALALDYDFRSAMGRALEAPR